MMIQYSMTHLLHNLSLQDFKKTIGIYNILLVGEANTTSHYTTIWGSKKPRTFECMKHCMSPTRYEMNNVHMTLHGRKLHPTHLTEVYHKIGRPRRFKSHNPWLVITYYVKGSAWIGWQWNNIWSSLVWLGMSLHYVKPHDHTKFNFICSLHGLQMSFKGPHNCMITALGHNVKWPIYSIHSKIEHFSRSNSQHNLKFLCDHLKRKRIFTLTSQNLMSPIWFSLLKI